MAKTKKSREEEFIHEGGRNLLLLCFGAIVIAIITTSISVWIYRITGDIYLDRSRPGYISEDEEPTGTGKTEEVFSKDGKITPEVLKEYSEQLKLIEEKLDASGEAFTEAPISDETLGIGSEKE